MGSVERLSCDIAEKAESRKDEYSDPQCARTKAGIGSEGAFRKKWKDHDGHDAEPNRRTKTRVVDLPCYFMDA